MKKIGLAILVIVTSLVWLPFAMGWLVDGYQKILAYKYEISIYKNFPHITKEDVVLAKSYGYTLHCPHDMEGEIAYCTYCKCEKGAGYTQPFGGGYDCDDRGRYTCSKKLDDLLNYKWPKITYDKICPSGDKADCQYCKCQKGRTIGPGLPYICTDNSEPICVKSLDGIPQDEWPKDYIEEHQKGENK